MSKSYVKKKAITLSMLGGFLLGLSSCNKPLDPLPSNKTSTISNISYDEDKLPNAPASFINKTYTYNGESRTIEVSDFSYENNPNVKISYSILDSDNQKSDGNGKIDVGTYTITASFLSKTTNLKVYKDLTAVLTIVKATYNNVSSISLENDGVYSYDENKTYSLKVIDKNILNLFDVTYDESQQNKKEVGSYSVTTTFKSKDGNYNDFTRTLYYSIIESKVEHTITFINPYEETNNVIVFDKLPKGITFNNYLKLNPEKKNQLDKIVETQSVKAPFVTFKWNYDFDKEVSDSTSILNATSKNVRIDFSFPENSGMKIRNGNLNYIPYITKYESKDVLIDGKNTRITYAKIEESTEEYNIFDIDFELNGNSIQGFYIDKDYNQLLHFGKIVPSMFNPYSLSDIHFDLLQQDRITIYVNIA